MTASACVSGRARMNQRPLNLAIVGCGNIAASYAKTLQPYSQLKLLGATSRTLKRAEDFVATFGGKVYPSLEAILADDEVDLVINLTIHHAHVEVITKCQIDDQVDFIIG